MWGCKLMVYEEDKILTETEAVECKIKLLSALLVPTKSKLFLVKEKK